MGEWINRATERCFCIFSQHGAPVVGTLATANQAK